MRFSHILHPLYIAHIVDMIELVEVVFSYSNFFFEYLQYLSILGYSYLKKFIPILSRLYLMTLMKIYLTSTIWQC